MVKLHFTRVARRLVLLGSALVISTACDGRSLHLTEDAQPSSLDTGPELPAPTPDLAPAADLQQEPLASCEPALGIEGPCNLVLGFRWDGGGCVGVSGCGCSGAACDRVFLSMHECEVAHRHCPAPPLGEGDSCDLGDDRCGDGLACCSGGGCGVEPPPDSENDFPCGEPTCLAVGDGPCPSGEIPDILTCNCLSVWMPVCGDDGKTYSNDCVAGCAGVKVLGFGECGGGITQNSCLRTAGDGCSQASDCLAGGCGGELCYNPAQSDGISDCDCAGPGEGGPVCGCVAGQCAWQ